MNETSLIVLGAILALLGGFIQRWYQECQDRKKHDKLLLGSVHVHIQTLEHIRYFAESNVDIGSIADSIYQISFEIQARKFKELRIKLKKLGKKHKRSNRFDQLDSTELESIEKELIKEIGSD